MNNGSQHMDIDPGSIPNLSNVDETINHDITDMGATRQLKI